MVILAAVAGSSGPGKTWPACELKRRLRPNAVAIPRPMPKRPLALSVHALGELS